MRPRVLCLPAAPLVLALVLLAAAAHAQRVVFVSDRFDPLSIRQSEIYLWEDGSEVRLTQTPGWAEYDPSPSPDGDLIAAAATNFLFPITSYDDEWSWRYVVLDEQGRQQDTWPIDGSSGMFRPAGGYQISWLPDGRSFLANAYDDRGDWTVRRYVRDSRQTIGLGPGYEIAVHPDGDRFATSHDGIVYLVDIASGVRETFAGGRPLGWTPDGSELFFEQAGTLFRAAPDVPGQRRVVSDRGPYVALRFAPDGERYAVASVAGLGSSVDIHGADHEQIGSWYLEASVVTLDWMDDERLVAEVADANGLRLELLGMDGMRTPFVDSYADDGWPRTIR